MPTLTERFLADIDGLGDLPSLSPVLSRLIATLGRTDASVHEVAGIIRRDPVLAARVLRAANSAAYAGRSPVLSIRDALLRLGLVRVRRLALLASLYEAVPGPRAAGENFWHHSVGVAHGAEIIARWAKEGPPDADPEVAFVTGLLHDIGLLVLESHYPREAAAVMAHADSERVPLHVAEFRVLQADHGELGGLLAAHWAMPEPIWQAIRAHHRPALAPAAHRWSAYAVHLADVLVSREGIAGLREGSAEAVDPATLDVLGLDETAVADIVGETRTEVRKALTALAAPA